MQQMNKSIDPLSGHVGEFARPKGKHLLDRLMPLHEWVNARRKSEHWQYMRALTSGPVRNASLLDTNLKRYNGVNFAVQDYLGLSTHPEIIDAAREAAVSWGVHSAGSACLLGNSRMSWELQDVIADFTQYSSVKLFPTGWAAAFGVVYGLIQEDDYVLMDQLSHASLQTGAAAATRNIVRYHHNNLDDLRKKLVKIRANSPEAGLLVIMESLYSMDSDVPDIKRAQELVHAYDGILLLDVAHDLGNLGVDGKGFMAEQGMLGKVDLIMGSFSKTFASNGGFVATNHPALDDHLGWFSSSWPFSNGLSPIQCAVVAKSFEIIRSDEGQELRQSMLRRVKDLRQHLQGRGLEVMGQPSAIVPVLVGKPDVIRTASRLLPEMGVFANMVEYPVVPLPRARFRMQVMASHTEEDVIKAADGVANAVEKARMLLLGSARNVMVS